MVASPSDCPGRLVDACPVGLLIPLRRRIRPRRRRYSINNTVYCCPNWRRGAYEQKDNGRAARSHMTHWETYLKCRLSVAGSGEDGRSGASLLNRQWSHYHLKKKLYGVHRACNIFMNEIDMGCIKAGTTPFAFSLSIKPRCSRGDSRLFLFRTSNCGSRVIIKSYSPAWIKEISRHFFFPSFWRSIK